MKHTLQRLLKFFVIILLLSGYSRISNGQNTIQLQSYSDDWVATDGADRTLPTHAEVGNYKKDKYVGIFYWLWHAYIRTNPIKNVTEELRRTNGNPNFAAQDWYWAEPENNYYHNSDPWVARRHLQMMANAGVDFIYIDYTNGNQGSESFDGFMNIATEMQNQGIPVPKFVFFINDEGGRTAMDYVYSNVYKPGKYKSLWFYLEGKPLMMESADRAPNQEIQDFFTFRETWAFQESTTDQWRFVDNYPQRPSYHNGVAEQLCVNKSMGAPLLSKGALNDKGSSYTKKNGTPAYNSVWETPRTPFGDYFEEQWTRVHEVNPSIVCITGWNEWTAGQWETNDPGLEFMGKPCNEIKWYMVDEFNVEFNRDIEPVKGEFTDNYYYQMVNHIRKYKGMKEPQTPSAPQTISVDANFAEWATVFPMYRDAQGDVQHRDFKNVNNSGNYLNTSGRNDIVETRSTFDTQNIYFYVKNAFNISAFTDAEWMLLLLDTDKNKSTGWNGYDYIINKGVVSATSTTLKSWNGSSWQNISNINYRYANNEMEISVPRNLIDESGTEVSYYYKFSDNQGTDNIADLFVNGDAAPDRRFNYTYGSSVGPATQTSYKILEIPGTIEAEDFDNGGNNISYLDLDTINNGGKYRKEWVDIETTQDITGINDVGWTNDGEWLEYTVIVSKAGSYDFTFRVAADANEAGISVDLDGNNIIGETAISPTGGWQSWDSVLVPGISLPSGEHIVRLNIIKGGVNLNYVKVAETTEATCVENLQSFQFKLYPIPTTEFIRIEGLYNDDAWTVTTILGVEKLKGTGQKIDLSGFDAGQYFVLINGRVYRVSKL